MSARVRRRVAASVVGLAVLVACGELVTSPALVGSIRVQARTRDGIPLPGIKAILYNGDRHLGYAKTRSDGDAIFARVPIGIYGVALDLPAEYAGLNEVTNVPPKTVAVPIQITPGKDTAVAFTFLRRGSGGVEATVLDSSGAPVTGVVVTLYNALQIIGSRSVGADGRARFFPVPFGGYGVFVTPPDSLGVPGAPTVYRDDLIVERDHVARTTITLARCLGTANVLVLDQAAVPIAGHPVLLYTWQEVKRSLTTGADGRVSFTDQVCDVYGARAGLRSGYTNVDTQGQAYVDGIVVTNYGVTNTTLHVIRDP